MHTSTETGHDKNVTYFQQLIATCSTFGSAYNPPRADLKIAALDALYTQARATLDAVIQKNTDFHIAENNRRNAFSTFKPLATRIINALKATGASESTIEDAKSINRKIQGASTAKKEKIDPNNPTVPVNHISTSQQSYNSQIEHLAKLISLLTNEPKYTLTDPEINLSDLNTYHTQLTALNLAHMQADATLKDTRTQRNKMLYAKDTGLCEVAHDVKSYIKAIYGATSSQYKQIAKMKFINCQ